MPRKVTFQLAGGPSVEGTSHSLFRTNLYAGLSLFLGLFYWVGESALHAFFFQDDTFFAQLLTTDEHELWKRALILLLLVSFGLYAQHGINAQRRTRRALKKSEAIYRTLIHEALNPIFVFDTHGRFVDFNQATLDFFELDGSALRSLTFHNATSGATCTQVAARQPEQVPVQPGLSEWDIAVGDRSKTLLLNIVPLAPEIQGAEAFFGIGHDITERKHFERNLRLAHEELTQIFQTASSAMRLIDLDHRMIKVNESFLELAGISAEEALVLPCHEALGGDRCNTEGCPIKQVMAGANKVELRVDKHRRDDTTLTCLLTARPFFDAQGEAIGIVESFNDITELKASHAAALRSEQLAAIGALAAGVAHEINNPINGIINYGQMLLIRERDPVKIQEIGRRIVSEGDRIARIVASLLSYARREVEEECATSVEELIDECLILIGAMMKREAIAVDVSYADGLPRVRCVPQQIQQVFLNIISNARDALNRKYASSTDQKRLEIFSELDEADDRRWVRVSFRDNGTGIPDEILDKVMKPFFSTKPKGMGTGLGLSISGDIVRDNGGELSLESEVGHFTTLSVRLLPEVSR